jgi:hypothetical protein
VRQIGVVFLKLYHDSGILFCSGDREHDFAERRELLSVLRHRGRGGQGMRE